ncbi:GH32 C-terminal domain-containing protein [Zongyangia hominis]|uniref:GH32 C-terminal domain-containing protein n=1 Tax=Zongyangia hominis TaxID=2763677 RepID=A0A926IC05_9FIRM|nr:GH32 C-terminal domain-containing protein [Zongyangia hominis]MBC8570615.1 GH32 C-terminal domain-containing protein [Zongyangia hominis]
MKNGTKVRRSAKRGFSLLFALMVAFSSVIPGGLLTASAAAGGLDNLHGDHVTTEVTGYEVGNTGGNSHALSSTSLTAFTYEADIKYVEGNKATLIFGSGTSDYTQLGQSAEKTFFGLEFTKDEANKQIKLKMFEDGAGGLGDNIIQDGTVGASDVDFSKNIHVKIAVDADNKLSIEIGGKPVSFELKKDFAGNYEGGYLGMLTWISTAVFSNIKVTDDTTGSEVALQTVSGAKLTPLVTSELAKLGGNNLAVSDTKTAYFEYETNILYKEGNKATLMFGAESNVPSELGNQQGATKKFFAVELERDGDAANATLKAKMFQDGPGAIGVFLDSTEIATGLDTTQPVNFKVVVNADKNIELYVGGKKADLGDISAAMGKFQKAYAGGYLGLVTYETNAIFSDIKVVNNGTEVTDGFRTNLPNLKFVNGTWNRTDDGLYSNGNDIFAMSDVKVKNFSLEATATIEGNAAAGLVFRAGSIDNPKDPGTYIANLHVERGTARMFTFGQGGGDISNEHRIDKAQKTYKLKLVVVDNKINYYVDDVLACAVTNDKFPDAGYLGLMTFGGAVTYQDVNYTELNAGEVPALTGLEVEGGTLGLSPDFDPDVLNYSVFAGTADSVKVIPTAADGTTLTIGASGASGVVLEDTAINSGEGKEITLPVGETTINIKATKGNLTMGTVIKVTKKASAEFMAAEPYRPQFHFSPEINFMNDPNGLVFDPSNDTWHMYFQYSPQVGHMGSQTWGHAQSKDLVTWEEMPVAIPMDELGAIFSGSAVVDENNTSGFFTDNKDGESKLVAIFTHAGGRGQVQSIAYSKDHGVTWTKYAGNPVLDESDRNYGGDFRDPKVWWQEDADEPAGGLWLMVVAGGRGQLFSSHDLKNWEFEQAFFHDGGNGNELHSECPALFPVKVEGTNDTKWLYVASSDWYAVGDLVKQADGWRFVNVTNSIGSANGGASKMYAGQFFYNDGAGLDRKLMVHWLQDYSAPGTFPDKRWNGVQSIPRTTGLKMIDGTYHMTAYPAKEIDTYRDEVIFTTKNNKVDENTPNILAGAAGQYYDIEAVFTPGTAKEFGFKLRTGNGQETIVKYNTETEKLIFDKSKSGPVYTEYFDWTLHPMEDGKIQLRILVDNSVFEIFGNYGDADIADLCFPDPDSIGMEFFADGGDVTIDEMNIWQMKSMFTGSSAGGTDPVFLSLSAPDIVDPGAEFTVRASVLPVSATDKTVSWEIPEGLTVVEKTDTYLVLKADAEGEYTVKATSTTGGLEKEITVKVQKRVFNTNVSGWVVKGGTWVKTGEGMEGKNAGTGDCFYLSENILPNTPFSLEADVKTISGQASSLVFGIQDWNNPGATWYCFNVENNSGKFFKNVNGAEVIKKTYNLTDDQKKNRTFKMKVVYDGAEFVAYLDGVEVARFDDTQYNGGYMGLLTYHSDTLFNNVYLTLEGEEIVAVDPIADIEVQLGSETTMDDIIAKLPAEVTVEMTSGAKVLANVTNWDTSKVDLTKAGTYEITGTVEGTEIPAVIKVVVKAEAVFESLTPAELNVTAKAGSTAEEVFAKLNKNVVANYSDGSKVNLVLADWDTTNVNFNEAGVYVATGKLTVDGEPFAETIKINVTITKENGGTVKPVIPGGNGSGSDWKWPEGNGSDSDNSGKKNPNSGDNAMLPIALAVLAASAGAVVLTRKKK